MSIDILNPGTIRIWGYDGPSNCLVGDLMPEPITFRGVRVSWYDFKKFWSKEKISTSKFRSIIRKAKQIHDTRNK